MIIAIATSTISREVKPYKDYNSSVNCNALILKDGIIVCGKVYLHYPQSNEIGVIISTDGFPLEYRTKEDNIIGLVSFDLSGYEKIELIDGE